jgi:hypothetical protein
MMLECKPREHRMFRGDARSPKFPQDERVYPLYGRTYCEKPGATHRFYGCEEQTSFPPVCRRTTHFGRRSLDFLQERNMKNILVGSILALTLSFPVFAQDVVVVPDPVTTWVTEQPMDDDVVVEEKFVVGDTLPDKVVIKNVKDHDDYGFAVVNKKRVIVEPKTRRVVKIID